MDYYDRAYAISQYAIGKQDIEKYKQFIMSGTGRFMSVNWRKASRKPTQRFWSRQPYKSYKMINRLKSL